MTVPVAHLNSVFFKRLLSAGRLYNIIRLEEHFVKRLKRFKNFKDDEKGEG